MARTQQKRGAPAPAQKRRGDTTKPDYMLRLMGAVGGRTTAELLGVSTATLYRAKRVGVVSQPIELAARMMWFKHLREYASQASAMFAAKSEDARTSNLGDAIQAQPSQDTVLCLVQVPRGREGIIEEAAIALGGVLLIQA